MTSPAKRRKKNDFQSSTQPVRSLDFFFGKQGNKATKKDDSTTAPNTEIGSASAFKNADYMTDEELAKKLQEEWNNEDPSQTDVPITNHQAATRDASGGILPTSGTGESHENVVLGLGPSNDKGLVAPEAEHKKDVLSLQSASSAEDALSLTIPFDENPMIFDPSKYIPELKHHWAKEGGNASYALLTRCFVLVSGTSSRIKIVDTLVNFLRTIVEGDPESLLPAVWLTTNAIAPPYLATELGLGGSAISKALKKVCGLDSAGLKTLYDKHGDAGDVAFEAKKRQSFTLRKPKPLSIQGVYESLLRVANSKGNGSQENKQRIVERLLQDARGAEESRYIVRTLCQHLRIGAVKTTMLIALARAFLFSRPPGAEFDVLGQVELAKLKKDALAEVYGKAEEIVKASFARRPNYNDLVPCMLEIGVTEELLLRCGLALHIPLRPMLGSITRDLGEMLTKLQGRDFSCEYKYDGQRAQVHCDDQGKVSIFSRHLEVMTDKYPDLVALVPQIRGEGVSSFILEGEVVAVDQDTGELKPFQTLSNRARKDVAVGNIKIEVCLFAFDLMYLNGEQLLDRPFRERRELLRSLFVEIPNQFTWVKSLDATSGDSEVVLEFFKSATDTKCEGIMVKVLDNLPNPDLQAQMEDDALEMGTSTPAPPPASSRSGTSAPPTPSKSKNKNSKAKPPLKPQVDPDNPSEKDKHSSRRKPLPSTYTPDKRVDSWLKVKKDYNSTHSETLDLIPVAAWHGQGRKAAWWSPILLAVRHPDSGTLVAVTKCMSGFTDSFYKANKAFYADDDDCVNTLPTKPSYVEYSAGNPDIWFAPQEVWEVAFADITLSPTYTAAIGLVSEERGVSLRFPRFLGKREDKSIEEASDVSFLAGLWRKQEERAKAEEGEKKKQKAVDDDYELYL